MISPEQLDIARDLIWMAVSLAVLIMLADKIAGPARPGRPKPRK